MQTNPLDLEYMLHLVAVAREHLGYEVVLYTTDGGDYGYMVRGTINGSAVYTVGDFGFEASPGGAYARVSMYLCILC